VNQETKFSAIESKLGINLPEGINQHYIETIASWLGTPYKYGGTTRSGADCSGFVQSVYRDVFKLTVDHQSEALFKKSKQIKVKKLKQFRIKL